MDPDQTSHHAASDLDSAASDMGLHCLPMSHKKDARRIWAEHDSSCETPFKGLATRKCSAATG